MSIFSQKLQNANALVRSFYDSLREDDVKGFRDIIMLRGESAGWDNNGHYMRDDGQLATSVNTLQKVHLTKEH